MLYGGHDVAPRYYGRGNEAKGQITPKCFGNQAALGNAKCGGLDLGHAHDCRFGIGKSC
jgi:hypothetical protein